jgi:hypothetical protein
MKDSGRNEIGNAELCVDEGFPKALMRMTELSRSILLIISATKVLRTVRQRRFIKDI